MTMVGMGHCAHSKKKVRFITFKTSMSLHSPSPTLLDATRMTTEPPSSLPPLCPRRVKSPKKGFQHLFSLPLEHEKHIYTTIHLTFWHIFDPPSHGNTRERGSVPGNTCPSLVLKHKSRQCVLCHCPSPQNVCFYLDWCIIKYLPWISLVLPFDTS